MPAGSGLANPEYAWLHDKVLGEHGERVAKVRRLRPIADGVGCSTARLAIAWCLANPHVSTVMLGASRLEQLEHNLGALEVLPKLDDAMRQRIAQAVN